jgi:hypothetical protein
MFARIGGHMFRILLALSLCFGAIGVSFSQVQQPSAPADHRKPATHDEELRMKGKLLFAIEDAGGGYTREALSRFSWISKELERREYSLNTRWSAHYWYAQVLLDSGKSKAAVEVLHVAQLEADSLSEKERNQTTELIQKAQESPPKK